MAEIKKSNGREIIDYMARDYDSLLHAMREQIPRKLPEWEDHLSEADFGNVLLQLFAHMGDILSYYQDRVANESFLGTAQTRRSIIQHLSLIGYQLSTAAPASTKLTLLVPVKQDETITISKGDAFATKSQKDKPSIHFEYTRETSLTIDCSTLPRAIKLENGREIEYKLYGKLPNERNWTVSIDPNTGEQYKLLEGIPVEEGYVVRDEILGQSDGLPNQQFTLAHPQLILRSLGQSQAINRDITLIAELEGEPIAWTLQESLAFSRERQPDFIIKIDDQDQATVIFGDGAFGAIPESLIKVTYRRGGGRHGNVPKNTIETIVDAPQLNFIGAQVTNPAPATGGAERESIDHAVRNAPTIFRSLKRAVTEDDYKALALNFKGVGKVRAQAADWNRVKLFVAPEGGGQVSDVLEANLLAYFEDKRPISTIIEIEDVAYVKIYVKAEVKVGSYYAREDIKEKVETTAGSLLAFDNVDFGQTLYLSKFYESIESIDGVNYVTITEFRREDEANPLDASGRIDLEVDALPSIYLGKIELAADQLASIPDEPNYSSGVYVCFEGEC